MYDSAICLFSFAIQIPGTTTFVNLLCFLHFSSVNLAVQINCYCCFYCYCRLLALWNVF